MDCIFGALSANSVVYCHNLLLLQLAVPIKLVKEANDRYCTAITRFCLSWQYKIQKHDFYFKDIKSSIIEVHNSHISRVKSNTYKNKSIEVHQCFFYSTFFFPRVFTLSNRFFPSSFTLFPTLLSRVLLLDRVKSFYLVCL